MMEASMGAADAAGTSPNMPNGNGSYVNEKKTIGNVAKMSTKNIITNDTNKSTIDISGADDYVAKNSNSASIESGSIAAIANMLTNQK